MHSIKFFTPKLLIVILGLLGYALNGSSHCPFWLEPLPHLARASFFDVLNVTKNSLLIS